MQTAKYGSKKFEVTSKKIYTPDSFEISESLNIETEEVAGKKPKVTIKGIELKEASFSVVLDERFVNVSSERSFWKSACTSKKSQALYIGNYPIGYFYVQSVQESNIVLLKGKVIKETIAIKFKEDPTKKISSSSSSSSSTIKNTNNVLSSKKTTVSKTIKKGTKIKPKNGVRWYYTAEGAIKRTGKSGKAYNKVMTVTYIYKNGKAINPQGLGWLLPKDVDVV